MGDVRTNFNSLLTKLDNDTGIADTNYYSTLAVDASEDIVIPDDINFPLPKDEAEADLYMILSDYFIQYRQTLTEIESKL